MKKLKIFLMAVLAVFGMAMTSCTSCHHDVDQLTSLNFDAVVRADYENMCSNVDSIPDSANTNTVFYEAQVWFDNNLDLDTVHNITEIRTVFQYKDTCTIFYHKLVNGAQFDSVSKINSYWLEDLSTSPYNRISLDSAIVYAKNQAQMPSTNYVVMRRPLCPPFVRENYYIFGSITNCITIDALDGHLVVDWGEAEQTKYASGLESEK